MRIGETIVQTLWVGALWTVGYLVAPALFEYLETPAEAGRIAGELFTIVTWLSMVCGALLLLAAGRSRHHRSGALLRVALILAMMILLGASEWIVRPMMEASGRDPGRRLRHAAWNFRHAVPPGQPGRHLPGGPWRP